jgi:APA family basic amino acid/polyamine antiporter
MITGAAVAVAAAFLPVGQLADIANAGTLYAFALVAIAVLVLRKQRPDVKRPFRVQGVWVIAPAAVAGCIFLFLNLPLDAMIVLPVWSAIGIAIYLAYGRSRSHLGKGIVEVVDDIEGDEALVPIDPPKD